MEAIAIPKYQEIEDDKFLHGAYLQGTTDHVYLLSDWS